MKNSAISERKNQSISRGVGMTTQIYADRAENSEIWDVEGVAISISRRASPSSTPGIAIPG